MSIINNAYINALLADFTYVGGLTPELTGDSLANKLSSRMTTTQAQYIGQDFTIVTGFQGAHEWATQNGEHGADYIDPGAGNDAVETFGLRLLVADRSVARGRHLNSASIGSN